MLGTWKKAVQSKAWEENLFFVQYKDIIIKYLLMRSFA